MKVLELGLYVIPAYAGMVLAEQGHKVTKWIGDKPDPIQTLEHGADLWIWANEQKTIFKTSLDKIKSLQKGDFDLIIDNFRPYVWESLGINPEKETERLDCTWVSMRDDMGDRSFDAVAQARAWGDFIGYLPFYIGDTTGGLWLAFKALSEHAKGRSGHSIIYQATCLAKLVEGELRFPNLARDSKQTPWDLPGSYGSTPNGVLVQYKNEIIEEPFRDQEWRRKNLKNNNGKFII